MTELWPRVPITDAEHIAILSAHWNVFPAETVVAIAEGWNGGLSTAQMADDLHCKPGSLRCLIGRLTQLGVGLRKAATSWSPLSPIADGPAPIRPRVKPLAPNRLYRMRRLADFDPVIARALQTYERTVAL